LRSSSSCSHWGPWRSLSANEVTTRVCDTYFTTALAPPLAPAFELVALTVACVLATLVVVVLVPTAVVDLELPTLVVPVAVPTTEVPVDRCTLVLESGLGTAVPVEAEGKRNEPRVAVPPRIVYQTSSGATRVRGKDTTYGKCALTGLSQGHRGKKREEGQNGDEYLHFGRG
jgi:hypothetical protein